MQLKIIETTITVIQMKVLENIFYILLRLPRKQHLKLGVKETEEEIANYIYK